MPKISLADQCNGMKAKIPNNINKFSCDHINKCWSMNPDDRPLFGEI